MGKPLFVVVNGPPGSGKTTLAEDLAARLALPLFSKDAIKEVLMDECEVSDVETSRQLGQAAITSLIASAHNSTFGAVLEANFKRSLAVLELTQLQGHVVEVFCRCLRELCLARYRERSADRHPGHFDAERSADDVWDDENTNPIAGGWRVIEVDTSVPVDVASLLEELANA